MSRSASLLLTLPLLALAWTARPAREDTRTDAHLAPSSDDAAESMACGPSARVAPGLVRWHADFDAACAAARASGKPVLLFQLLGRLDDELC